MQRILLVNLMRMGDILQSTPVVAGLRKAYPQAEIHLAFNEAFAETVSRIDVDEAHPFPLAKLRNALASSEGWLDAFGDVDRFSRRLNERGPYDLLFNQTPSPAAAALCDLVEARLRRGMCLDRTRSFVPADPYSAYLVAMMSHRKTNPFHLVDIWLGTLKLHGPSPLRMSVTDQDREQAADLLHASGVHPERELVVGFQVSASQPEKCWSEEAFVRLGRQFEQSLGARVLVLGVSGEQALCHRVASAVPGAISLAGRTTLGELAGLLCRTAVLVTNDTGTQHVAAAVGTSVVVVSVGPVFFRETGPYGEGHRVLQARLPCAPCSFHVSCTNPVCKERIRPEYVYALAVSAMRKAPGPAPDFGPEVRSYRSGFDDRGRLEFTPDNPDGEDEILRFHRDLWAAILEGNGAHPGPIGLPPGDGKTRRRWDRLASVLHRASDLMDRMRTESVRGLLESQGWKHLGDELRQKEEELRCLAREAEDLSPLVHYLLIRRECLPAESPLAFLRLTSDLYRAAAARILSGPSQPSPEQEGGPPWSQQNCATPSPAP